jgi:hypothetical protein
LWFFQTLCWTIFLSYFNHPIVKCNHAKKFSCLQVWQ